MTTTQSPDYMRIIEESLDREWLPEDFPQPVPAPINALATRVCLPDARGTCMLCGKRSY